MSASLAGGDDQFQATMLVQAAEAGDFGAVEALIAAGVDVNGATEHGMTALMAAAANGHLDSLLFCSTVERTLRPSDTTASVLWLWPFSTDIYVLSESCSAGAQI